VKRLGQKMAEVVVTDLTEKSSSPAEARHPDRYIGRSAAGSAAEGRSIGQPHAAPQSDEIDEELTAGHDIEHGSDSPASRADPSPGRSCR
jgi:hypothetical protein